VVKASLLKIQDSIVTEVKTVTNLLKVFQCPRTLSIDLTMTSTCKTTLPKKNLKFLKSRTLISSRASHSLCLMRFRLNCLQLTEFQSAIKGTLLSTRPSHHTKFAALQVASEATPPVQAKQVAALFQQLLLYRSSLDLISKASRSTTRASLTWAKRRRTSNNLRCVCEKNTKAF